MSNTDPQPTRLEKELFDQLVELETREERQATLDRLCAGNAPLRARLEALLRVHDEATGFLPEQPQGLVGTPTSEVSASRAAPTGAGDPQEGPGMRIGRYKLLEQIGEGGCGVVYMADQEQPVRRRVALKVIRLGMDTRSVIARFEAERQALALMDHPNIAKVLDAGATESGRPYFVMELVRGLPITRYCDEARLGTAGRLELFVKVCQAIQHAHQKGIVHRDIKPSNILVTIHDGVAVPKVIDFGIAKATHQQPLTEKTLFTAFQQFVGTPAYMSPEQAGITSDDIDTRSDIYSLGVLLYELLTGRTPFDGRDLLAAGLDVMRRTIREVEPARPSNRLRTLAEGELSTVAQRRHTEVPRLLQAVQGDLDWIVMKALDKDRNRRYESANGFAQDVLRHLESEPVIARPPSTGYRLRKAIARHRLAFAAGLAVFATLALGLGISTRLYLQKSVAFQEQARERARAEAATERANAEAATAEAARREAEHQRRAAVTNLVNLHIAEGWRRSEDGDYFGALAPFQAALELEKGDAEREAVHQLRLSAIWQHCPKLLQEFSVGTNLTGAEFDSDGSRLLVATSLSPTQAVARVWDPFAGEALTPAMEHNGTIHSVEWGAGESRVVTASEDGTAKLWESRSGRLVMPPFRHTNGVTRATLDPLGRWVATATWGNVGESDPFAVVNLFSLKGTEGQQPLRIETRRVWDGDPFQFTSDGTRLVTHSTVVQLGQSELPKVAILPIPQSRMRMSSTIGGLDRERWHFDFGRGCSVVSNPLGRGFSTHSSAADTLFRLDTGETLQEFQELALVEDGVFSEPTRSLLTLHADSAVRVWDAATGKPISSFAVPGPAPESLVASAQGNEVALSQVDGTVTIRASADGRLLLPPLPHPGRVVRMKFACGDAYLVTVGREGWVRVWDLRSPQSLVTLVAVTNATSVTVKRPSRDGMLPIVWDLPSGTAVACGWNVKSYARTSPMLHFPESELAWWGERWVRSTRQSGHGSLQIQQGSGEVQSIRASNFREFTFIEGTASYGLFSQHFFANITADGSVSVVTRDTLTEVFRAHAVEWAWWWGRDNEVLVQQTNGTLEVWDVASSNRLGVLGARSKERLTEVISSPEGERVLTLGNQGAQLWSTKTREAESPLIRFPAPWEAKADPSLVWIAYPLGAGGVSCHHLRDGTQRRIAVPRGLTVKQVFALTTDLLLAVAASGNACLIHVPSGEWVVAAMTFPSVPQSIAVDAEAGVAYVGCVDGRVMKWPLPAATDPGELRAIRTLGLLGPAYMAPGSYRASKSIADTHTTHTNRPGNPVSKTSGESQAIVIADWHLRRAESLGKTGLWRAALAHLESLLEGNAEPSELRLRWADLYAAAVRAGGVDSMGSSASVREVGAGTKEPRKLTLPGGTWKEIEDSALAAYRQAAAWYHRQGSVGLTARTLMLERRSALLADLGRYAESLQDLRVARGLSADHPVALNDALDLAPWFGDDQIRLDPTSAFRVPRHVVFRVEGCIAPSEAELQYLDREWMTRDILVGRRCQFLHFLIGCRAQDCCAVSGTLVGKLVMHLRGGQVHEQEIVYGRDLLDLRKPEPEESTPAQAQLPPAWSGRAAVPPDVAREVRLYALTWTNPIPGGEVVRLDFKAAKQGVVPMLFAVTAEP